MSDELLKELFKKNILLPPKENSWKDYARYCHVTKRQKMAMGKIRYMFADPLSRKALFKGTVYIEYVNQDPDRIEPVNLEKITQKLEWEGTWADWFGLLIVGVLLSLLIVPIIKTSFFTIGMKHPSSLAYLPPLWKKISLILKTKSFYSHEGENLTNYIDFWDLFFQCVQHILL